MAEENDDRVHRLAGAFVAWAYSGGDEELRKRALNDMRTERPSSEALGEIILDCSIALEPHIWAQAAPVLQAYLQRQLMVEHVAAQQGMTAAADNLQRAALSVARSSYWMAVASFIVTAAALYIAVARG
jgi:hypothetical protein